MDDHVTQTTTNETNVPTLVQTWWHINGANVPDDTYQKRRQVTITPFDGAEPAVAGLRAPDFDFNLGQVHHLCAKVYHGMNDNCSQPWQAHQPGAASTLSGGYIKGLFCQVRQ
jgi:hypothetical protein